MTCHLTTERKNGAEMTSTEIKKEFEAQECYHYFSVNNSFVRGLRSTKPSGAERADRRVRKAAHHYTEPL
jgi:hypothetical protein